MKPRGAAGVAAGAIAGFAAGAVLTLALQGVAVTRPGGSSVPSVSPPFTVREAPDTFLTWIPDGMPNGFRSAVAKLPFFDRTVVVASDNTWMTRSFDAQGDVVDQPRSGFAIPLEVGAVDPREWAPFLPPADRSVVVALADGQGILGESSAKLRGLGPGAVLEFGHVDVQIAAILPDELVGAAELFVSHDVGRTIGVTHDRYALLQPDESDGVPTDHQIAKQIRGIVPRGTLVQVRAPGETPYFRQGDAVLPPVQLKILFGEFAARLTPGSPGYLTLDPAWVRDHIATEHVPLLGNVTCNVALFPQIRGAIHEIVAKGLSDTITSYSGCYAHRMVNRVPTAGISHHTWGAALDINVPQNPYGAPPHQNPRMVAIFERWGFIWGGTFVRPDGMHFEYRRPPQS